MRRSPPERVTHGSGSAHRAQLSIVGKSLGDSGTHLGGSGWTSEDLCRHRFLPKGKGRYIIRSCPIERTGRNRFPSMGWVLCHVPIARSTSNTGRSLIGPQKANLQRLAFLLSDHRSIKPDRPLPSSRGRLLLDVLSRIRRIVHRAIVNEIERKPAPVMAPGNLPSHFILQGA